MHRVRRECTRDLESEDTKGYGGSVVVPRRETKRLLSAVVAAQPNT